MAQVRRPFAAVAATAEEAGHPGRVTTWCRTPTW